MKIRYKTEEELLAQIITENYEKNAYTGTLIIEDMRDATEIARAQSLRTRFLIELQKGCPHVKLILVMGRGMVTDRIHYHFIIRGIDLDGIKKAWKWGRVTEYRPLETAKELSADEPYRALAHYFCEHWTEEQGGFPFFETRNNTVGGKDYAIYAGLL